MKLRVFVISSPKDLTLYQAFDGYLDEYGPG